MYDKLYSPCMQLQEANDWRKFTEIEHQVAIEIQLSTQRKNLRFWGFWSIDFFLKLNNVIRKCDSIKSKWNIFNFTMTSVSLIVVFLFRWNPFLLLRLILNKVWSGHSFLWFIQLLKKLKAWGDFFISHRKLLLRCGSRKVCNIV